MNKLAQARCRRAKRARAHNREIGKHSLVVTRSACHIRVQLLSPERDRVLAAASTLEKEIREQVKITGNIAAAKVVGKVIAERVIAAGIRAVAFDRSGFKYHGRVKALADAAREGGLEF